MDGIEMSNSDWFHIPERELKETTVAATDPPERGIMTEAAVAAERARCIRIARLWTGREPDDLDVAAEITARIESGE